MSSRKIDKALLTLSASGWTYNTRFVLYDYESGSLWFPLTGKPGLTCISGYYADRVLENLPSVRAKWQDWKDAHPDSKFMKY